MSKRKRLLLRDDSGHPLCATASVEEADGICRFHLESQSGRSTSAAARNPDYKPALAVLLGRLALLSGTLVDAAVASRRRPGVQETSRELRPSGGLPLLLSGVDSAALRDELIQLQRQAGQKIGAGGTGAQHKRIRLDVRVGHPLQTVVLALESSRDDALQDVEDLLDNAPALPDREGARRRAVEQYAVQLAIRHYSQRFASVVSHELTEAFDLLCSSPGELRVEVKGTRSPGTHIAVTAAEVALARDESTPTELFVVSEIGLRVARDGLEGEGGIIRIYPAWTPRDPSLQALVYRCDLDDVAPGLRLTVALE